MLSWLKKFLGERYCVSQNIILDILQEIIVGFEVQKPYFGE